MALLAPVLLCAVIFSLVGSPLGTNATPLPPAAVRFAVIGDYGSAVYPEEGQVAAMIHGWNPDLIITVGDNNYEDGFAADIDNNIGQYYHDFIFPYTGSYGPGASSNKFFPSLGNHDWGAVGNPQPYYDYFTLPNPNNERYYDFTSGPVHFFALDADPHEPDGITSTSVQAQWLQSRLAAATEPWKVVYFHHPAYSSGFHHSTPELQWPYQAWGASIVLNGHDHDYERLLVNGFPYIVNGLGGRSTGDFGAVETGSVVRYTGEYGAMKVDASSSSITFQFINRLAVLIDTFTLNSSVPTGTSTPSPTRTPSFTRTPTQVRTSTPTPSLTRTPTATKSPTPLFSRTPTRTPTPVPPAALIGHVTWQGPPDQPDVGQQQPVTLTLTMNGTDTGFPAQNTDSSGFFTVTVTGMPAGSYAWRAKGPKYLSTAGLVTLSGAPAVSAEMGLMPAGDANGDDAIGTVDFNILKLTFGLSAGQPGYDDRADFTADAVVNANDFILMKNNFGRSGAPPAGP